MHNLENDIRLDFMKIGDVPAVHALEEECFSSPWDISAYYRELQNSSAFYIVAHRSEQVVGYGGMWTVSDEAHIVTLAVDREFRRQGVGRRLLAALLKEARRRRVARVTLEVRVSNQAAQRLYAEFDFRTIAFRREYYPDNGEDAAVMARELPD
jgi:ribosomal-protein-alanine N-acetyltransferase